MGIDIKIAHKMNMKKDEHKLDLRSKDIKVEKIEELKKVFPEVVSENTVDFKKLKKVLGEEVDEGQERYGMQWPGKSDCFKIIQQPSIGTLKPAKDE
jgi:adenine-specific DNA-methyltransferase